MIKVNDIIRYKGNTISFFKVLEINKRNGEYIWMLLKHITDKSHLGEIFMCRGTRENNFEIIKSQPIESYIDIMRETRRMFE